MPQVIESAEAVRDWDASEITCLRACVMKPEHVQWMEEILRRLGQATGPILTKPESPDDRRG